MCPRAFLMGGDSDMIIVNIILVGFISMLNDISKFLSSKGLWLMFFAFSNWGLCIETESGFLLAIVLFLVLISRIVPISSFYYELFSDNKGKDGPNV